MRADTIMETARGMRVTLERGSKSRRVRIVTATGGNFVIGRAKSASEALDIIDALADAARDYRGTSRTD